MTVAYGGRCGLWLLFHTLASRAHGAEATRVLEAIHAYVEHFFGCADCASHFLSMASSSNDPMPLATSVSSAADFAADSAADSAVLWLWRAHNKVNARLNSTGMRTVLRLGLPKVQYPSAVLCPNCASTTGRWDQLNTLRFLRRAFCQNEPGLVSCGAVTGAWTQNPR